MTSVSRLPAALAIAFAFVGGAHAAPLRVDLPCDRPMLVAGEDATVAPAHAPAIERPFASRMQALFARACGPSWTMRTLHEPSGRLVAAQTGLEAALRSTRPAVAVFDYAYADLAAGTSVDEMMRRYASLLRVCSEVSAVCVIGGQRPGDTLSAETSARQEQLERGASAAFGDRYLSTWAHFRSEVRGHRAMVGMIVGGDRPHLTELGHEVLFRLHRNRLIEITGSRAAGDAARH